jgi:hypothetical protein
VARVESYDTVSSNTPHHSMHKGKFTFLTQDSARRDV